MSTSRHTQEFLWVSRAAQLLNDMRRIQGGLSQVDQGARRSAGGLSLMDNQMKAIGTTARYAIAGGLVFSIVTAIRALAQFEDKMARIRATAVANVDPLGMKQFGKDLDHMADYAIGAAARLRTPIEQIQETMHTLYSSYDNVPSGAKGVKLMEDSIEVLTKLNKVSEATDTAKMAQGIVGITNTLGRGQQDIPVAANMLAKIVATTPSLKGDELTQGLGRLGGSAGFAGFSMAEMFGTLATGAQAGGSGAVLMRGGSQLMREIMQPRSDEQKAMYRSIGLPDTTAGLQAKGGGVVLDTIIAEINKAGGLFVPLGMERATGSQLDEMTGDPFADAKASGGGAALVAGLTTRAESLIFLSLMAKEGPAALDKFIRSMEEAGKNQELLNRQNAEYNREAPLTYFAESIKAFRLRLVSDPFINYPLHKVAEGVGGAASYFSQPENKNARYLLEGAVTLGAGALAVRSIRNMSRGGIAGVLDAGPAAAGAALGKLQTASMLTDVGAADGSFSRPFWVVISPVSWSLGGPSNTSGPPVPPVVPVAGPGRLKRWGGKAMKWGKWGAIPAAAGLAAYEGPGFLADHFPSMRGDENSSAPAGFKGSGMWSDRGVSWEDGVEVKSANAGQSRLRDLDNLEQRRARGSQQARHQNALRADGEVGIQVGLTPEASRLLDVLSPGGVSLTFMPAESGPPPKTRGKNRNARQGAR